MEDRKESFRVNIAGLKNLKKEIDNRLPGGGEIAGIAPDYVSESMLQPAIELLIVLLGEYTYNELGDKKAE